MVLVWSGGENWALELVWRALPDQSVISYELLACRVPPAWSSSPALCLLSLLCGQYTCAALVGAVAVCSSGGPLVSNRQLAQETSLRHDYALGPRLAVGELASGLWVCVLAAGRSEVPSVEVTSRNFGSPYCPVVVCCGNCGTIRGAEGTRTP